MKNTVKVVHIQTPHSIIVKSLNFEMSLVMRKPDFCICENKDADQLRGNREAVTAKLISAFVFATKIVQSLYFLNPKFQASSHLVRLYSPVCVGPGRKPRRPVFSQRGSNKLLYHGVMPLKDVAGQTSFAKERLILSIQQPSALLLGTIYVMTPSFRTDRDGQIVQTQIRLLL